MGLFGDIVKRILNEDKTKSVIKYESIKSDYVKGPAYVYHMTGKDNLKHGILKSGWESFYNAWNSYGPGIYTCVLPSFDPKANVTSYGLGSNPNPDLDASRQYTYGLPKNDPKYGSVKGIMLLCKTLKPHPFHSFLIFDEELAKTIYRNHWRPLDQLKLILGDKLFNEKMTTNIYLRKIGAYSKSAEKYINDKANANSEASDGYDSVYCRGFAASMADRACEDPDINRKVRGLIFHGPGDGFVAIFRDYNALEPIGVSYDLGHTFEPIQTEAEFKDYQINNVDVRSTLGLDRYFFSKTNTMKARYIDILKNVPFKYVGDTFFGDYALVGNTDNPKMTHYYDTGEDVVSLNGGKDWKWNFIYKPWIGNNGDYKKMMISPNIWFDKVSTKWHNNTAPVIKNGLIYYIVNKSDHFYIYNDQGVELGDLRELTEDKFKSIANSTNATFNNDVQNNTQNVETKPLNQTTASKEDNGPLENKQNIRTKRPKRTFGIRK